MAQEAYKLGMIALEPLLCEVNAFRTAAFIKSEHIPLESGLLNMTRILLEVLYISHCQRHNHRTSSFFVVEFFISDGLMYCSKFDGSQCHRSR